MSNRILDLFRKDSRGLDWPRMNWRAWLDDELATLTYTFTEYELAERVLTRLSRLDAMAQFDEGWTAGVHGWTPPKDATAEFMAGYRAGVLSVLAVEKRWEQAS